MKKYLLVLTMLLTTSVSYALDCSVRPSCEDLGYTKSAADCEGVDTLKCPFDTTAVFCFEEVETTVSCADQGYTSSGTALCLVYQDIETCPTDSNYFKCVDNATEIADYCTNLGFTKPGLVSCASGYTWSSCVADSSYTKCTATSSSTTDSCPTGYYLSGADELCDCAYGQYKDGTTSTNGAICWRCGTNQECGGDTGTQCITCFTSAL